MAYVLDDDNVLQNFKPCPFCGREPALQVDKRYPKWIKDSVMPVDGYTVICNTRQCPIYHADNTWFFTKEDAVNAWNERKTQQPDVITIDEMKNIPDQTDVWLEAKDGGVFALTIDRPFMTFYLDKVSKGEYRCWSARPTNEQQKMIPWVE